MDTDPRAHDAKLADYARNRAKYQAVIAVAPGLALHACRGDRAGQARGDLRDPPAQRQLYPDAGPRPQRPRRSPAIRAARPRSSPPRARSAFPYLKGPVPLSPDIAANVFGYQATPLAGANFTTLLTGPTTPPPGHQRPRERHRGDGQHRPGQPVPEPPPAAARRDARLGDAWRLPRLRPQLPRPRHRRRVPAATTSGTPSTTSTTTPPRSAWTPATCRDAVGWQNRTGLKLNMVYNMFGVTDGRSRRRPAPRGLQGQQERVPLDQPHLRPPEPRLHHRRRTPRTRSPRTSRSSTPTSTRRRARSRPGSTTRPSSSPASTPAWPTSRPATRARSTRR